MLGKLMKYDLKCMLKVLAPLWAVVLGLALVGSAQMYFTTNMEVFEGSNLFFSGLGLTMILVAVFMGILVVNVLFTIQRFWNGLLKEEGYLMFTLPVSTRSLIISKALSSFVIVLGSMILGVLITVIYGAMFFILAKEKVTFDFTGISQYLPSMLLYLAIGLLGIIGTIYQAYASMAIGHLSNRHRFIISVTAFFLLSMIINTITGIVQIRNPFFEFNFIGIQTSSVIIYIIGQIVKIVVFHAVTEIILSKHLNLT